MKQRYIRKREDSDSDNDEKGQQTSVSTTSTITNKFPTLRPTIDSNKKRTINAASLSFTDDISQSDSHIIKVKKSKLSQNFRLSNYQNDEANSFDQPSYESAPVILQEENFGGRYNTDTLKALKQSQHFSALPGVESQQNDDVIQLHLTNENSPHDIQSAVLAGEDAERLETIQEMELLDIDFIQQATLDKLTVQLTGFGEREQTGSEIEDEMKEAKLRSAASSKQKKKDRIFMSTKQESSGATYRYVGKEPQELDIDDSWEDQIATRAGITNLQSMIHSNLKDGVSPSQQQYNQPTITKYSNITLNAQNNAKKVVSTGITFEELIKTVQDTITSVYSSVDTIDKQLNQHKSEHELIEKRSAELTSKIDVGTPLLQFLIDMKQVVADCIGMLREKSPLIARLKETAIELIRNFTQELFDRRALEQEDRLYRLIQLCSTVEVSPQFIHGVVTQGKHDMISSLGRNYKPTGIMVLESISHNYTDQFGRSTIPPRQNQYQIREIKYKQIEKAILERKLAVSTNNKKEFMIGEAMNYNYSEFPVNTGLGQDLGFNNSQAPITPSSPISTSMVIRDTTLLSICRSQFKTQFLFTEEELLSYQSKVSSIYNASNLLLDDVKSELKSLSTLLNLFDQLKSKLPGRYQSAFLSMSLPAIIDIFALYESIPTSFCSSVHDFASNVEWNITKFVSISSSAWFKNIREFIAKQSNLHNSFKNIARGNGSDNTESINTFERMQSFDTAYVSFSPFGLANGVKDREETEEFLLAYKVAKRLMVEWYIDVIQYGFDPLSNHQCQNLVAFLEDVDTVIYLAAKTENAGPHKQTVSEIDRESKMPQELKAVLEAVTSVFSNSLDKICFPTFTPEFINNHSTNLSNYLQQQIYTIESWVQNLFVFKPILSKTSRAELLWHLVCSDLNLLLQQYLELLQYDFSGQNESVPSTTNNSSSTTQLYSIFKFTFTVLNEIIHFQNILEHTTIFQSLGITLSKLFPLTKLMNTCRDLYTTYLPHVRDAWNSKFPSANNKSAAKLGSESEFFLDTSATEITSQFLNSIHPHHNDLDGLHKMTEQDFYQVRSHLLEVLQLLHD